MRKKTRAIFNIFTILICLCLCNSCNGHGNTRRDVVLPEHIPPSGYYPIEPIPLNGILFDGPAQYRMDDRQKFLLSAIPNLETKSAVGLIIGHSSIVLGPFSVEANGSDYTVYYDYIKSTTYQLPVKLEEVNGNQIVTYPNKFEECNHRIPIYIGVTYRVRADITEVKGDIDISSLYGLGMSAEGDKIEGRIHVVNIGIISDRIENQFPDTSRGLDSETVRAAMNHQSLVQSEMSDEDTVIIPQIVAFSNDISGDLITVNSIKNAIRTAQLRLVIEDERNHRIESLNQE